MLRAGMIAGVCALLLLGAALVLDRLFPPDLSRYHDRSTMVLDHRGGILRAFLAEDGIWRLPADPARVDERYLRLLTAYEDQRFAHHPGVDPFAILRASGQMIAHGRIVSGASTLTMQAARLLEPRPRTLPAKLIEMLRAMQLEWRLSKDEILSIYLTLAPFGGNLEGVRAASLAYFGKEPDALTLGQAALLVALPQSPERLRPDRRPEGARAGQRKVLERLVECAVVTEAAAGEALSEPMPARRRSFPFYAPRLARDLAARAAPGSEIRTPIRPDIQQAAEALAERQARGFEDPASIGIVVLDNETRQLVAYVGGTDFWGRAGQVDVARALRSPGSALKPFIYGIAFDDHLVHPETLIEDRPMVFGAYAPENFDRGFQGTVTIRSALQQSLNVPAVALMDKVGPERFIRSLKLSGARIALPPSVRKASLPVALGGLGISLFDLTQLYMGLAKGGLMQSAFVVEGEAGAPDHRLMAPAAAWYVRDVLAGAPLPDGLGQARGIVRDRTVAFKTGTSYGFRDAWAVGFSRRYTVGVWVGRPDGTARPGHVGRNEAAPVMLSAFSLLPAEARLADTAPDNVLHVTKLDDLPRALRRFDIEPSRASSETIPGPQIRYPPHGATVPLSLLQRTEDQLLALSAEGGALPLRWVVNGEPLPVPDEAGFGDMARQVLWAPDGEGFTRITVVDRLGRSAVAEVRFVP